MTQFTIFTSTYNRVGTLPRVFESLQRQTYRDFEWVIVDDGSTDETSELVKRFEDEADFSISYVYQENQHKKTAFNRGVEAATGEFFLNADSDDEFVDDALERLHDVWISIPKQKRAGFAGVCGLCRTVDGDTIGDTFPSDVLDSNIAEMKYRYRVRGDKCGFIRTDILREHRFPEEISGMVPESVVWHAIGKRFQVRFINEPLRIVHMGDDQLTGSVPLTNVEGLAYWAAFTMEEEFDQWIMHDPKWFLKMASNYTRFKRQVDLDRLVHIKKIESLSPRVFVALCAPVGLALHARDRLGRMRKKI